MNAYVDYFLVPCVVLVDMGTVWGLGDDPRRQQAMLLLSWHASCHRLPDAQSLSPQGILWRGT